MFTYVPTLTDYLLEQERQNNIPASLTRLLIQIENATKLISSHVTKSGLADIMGTTGEKNAFSDEVQKLDVFTNDLLNKGLLTSGVVKQVFSEELSEPLIAETGEYDVFLDPLDGSSNIDVNAPIGTIFSVFKTNNSLQAGKEQIAGGYVLYGASTMCVLTLGKGVVGFTLDPAIGSFLLSHPDIKMPEKGSIYSLNEGSSLLYEEGLKQYLHSVKEKGYKARYIGSFIADIHRTLLKGGIFLYPKDTKHPNGKLRLMYEVNPIAFVVEQAGGKAISNGIRALEVIPEKADHVIPIATGSSQTVDEYSSFDK